MCCPPLRGLTRTLLYPLMLPSILTAMPALLIDVTSAYPCTALGAQLRRTLTIGDMLAEDVVPCT
jgi:hypothetical protein